MAANEGDSSSVSEDFDESLNIQELVHHVDSIATKIQRKKENLQEFVSSMKKENSINKTVLKRFQTIDDDFKENRKSKAEFKDLQTRLNERINEVSGKLQHIENALQYISAKEIKIKALSLGISDSQDNHEELLRFRNEVQSLFSEIKIKFRESKKVKLSLLTKFKPDDLIQSVQSWEKAADVAREIVRKVGDLQKEIVSKNAAISKMEEEFQEEKESFKEQQQEFSRLADDMKTEDESKKEQVELINTFRSLLDESEKLVRNLEAQNSKLNQIISDEKNRVSHLRENLSDLQEQIREERRSNRNISIKFEHMQTEFLAVTSENEGYRRDVDMMKKELVAIKNIKDEMPEGKQKTNDEEAMEESFEDLEEKLEIKDKMLEEKYLEVEQLKTELEKSLERAEKLEDNYSTMSKTTATAQLKLQVEEKENEELTDVLADRQAALESERLAKDEYLIRCEMLERKLALSELDPRENETKGENKLQNMEEEMQNLREQLEEERQRVAESSSLVEELEEQLIATEELREYEEDIKTRSIENIVQAELENRKLIEIVEDLRDKLSEKDNGIEELITHCAVEELRLREDIAGLTNQVQVYKRDCVYKANIIERLRRQVESHKRGLGVLDEEEEDTGTDLLVKAAALERQLHEERVRTMKYEEALLHLNKQCEENESAIREKDYELSRKSAEDGKRIAELFQELESDKTCLVELDEQIENLEEILSLKELIDNIEEDTSEIGNKEELEKELVDMKEDYAVKKLRRKDDMLAEMREHVDELKGQLHIEQKTSREQESVIGDLNEASAQDTKQIDQLQKKVSALEDESSSQREYIEELTERIKEGQKLISEMEGVADRERMRVATIEQLLLQDKQNYSKHLEDANELKNKVDEYQSDVGNLRTKIDRINRNLVFSPREGASSDGEFPGSRSEQKITTQKSAIKELIVNVNAVEEKNAELDAELKEQRGKNIEQDEKIDQLVKKSLECEDLVDYMKVELELIRKRYHGLSGSTSDEDRPVSVDQYIPETKVELEAEPTLLFPGYLGEESGENEGDDEHEEGDSGETIYFSEENESQSDVEQESNETKQRELIHQLLIFEKVFENIFAEEGRRIDVVLDKFGTVIKKNTELVANLQSIRETLGEARDENNRKEKELKEMKEHLERERNNKEEDEQRISELRKTLEEQQMKIEELLSRIKDETTRANQLKETLAVEQLVKSEYEREIEQLKDKVIEEREAAETLREEVERETNARYDFEANMSIIEEETINNAAIIDELHKDLETERKCYSIVTERLQAEQNRLQELEGCVKEAEETASNDTVIIEELRECLLKEEKQKMDFLSKLEKFEKESIEKDEKNYSLIDQLGNERNRMEELLGEIDLEKNSKSNAEAKLQELEQHFNRDELIFEELRGNIDVESAKNREISELLDKERENNLETNEKLRELEKQVLMDLELFDELKKTIEQEREHNRELDSLLSEKNTAFNNRDKLLSELDEQVAEIKIMLKKEQMRNIELNEELDRRNEKERKKNLENEKKLRELEKQVLIDLELFNELKKTIEQEREHNRELDSLLSEKSTAFNNRDKLLSELDEQVAENQTMLKKEQMRNIELSEELDRRNEKEQKKNLENQEKLRELEKQVLIDLELFDELKKTIEQEREHNRELDSLLSEKSTAFNNRDKLLSELDEQVAEIKIMLKKEQMRNIELNEELDRRNENERVIKDLQDMLKSQTIHAGEMDEKAQLMNKEQSRKIQSLENALEILRKLSAQVSRELENDLETSGAEIDVDEFDVNGNVEHSTEKHARRVKTLLANELAIKKSLVFKVDEFEKQLSVNEILLSERNGIVEGQQERIKEMEQNVKEERKQKEEAEHLLKKIENELQVERKEVECIKVDSENLKHLHNEIIKENENRKIELEKMTRLIEEKANKEDNVVKSLKDETEKVKMEKKESEEECTLMKKYYEEEHQFATERLEQIDLLKKDLEQIKTTIKEKDDELNATVKEKTDLTSSFEEKQANVLEELEDKIRKTEAKEQYITEIQKIVENMSHSHRRKIDARQNNEDATPLNEEAKLHLKELENEFDDLEEELRQKDVEIQKLKNEIKDEKTSLHLQNEIERLKPLTKQHEMQAQKAVTGLVKARLLIELLEADVEVKHLTICQLQFDINALKSEKDSVDAVSTCYQRVHKETTSETGAVLPLDITEGSIADESIAEDEQSSRLRAQIIHMATVMEKVNEHHERVIEDKDQEIEKKAKTITMMKDLYHSLKNEVKREEILYHIKFPTTEMHQNDADMVIKDLENQLKAMKDDASGKAETIKCLHENIRDMNSDENNTDETILSRKENLHKLLSVQLEEKEKKLKRMENLLDGLRKTYGRKSSPQPLEEAPITVQSVSPGLSREVDHENRDDTRATGKHHAEKESIDSTDSSKLKPSKRTCKPARKHIDGKCFPRSGWKIKLAAYILIGIGLSFLPQYLKIKTLRIVLACVATPFFFLLSTTEITIYRKKIEAFFKTKSGVTNHAAKGREADEEEAEKNGFNYLLSEEMNLNRESNQQIIQSLQEQLQQEIKANIAQRKTSGLNGTEVLREHKQKVENLENMLRSLEKARIDEQEHGRMSFNECKKLREDVEELRRRRRESKMDVTNLGKDNYAKLSIDLSSSCLSLRSLPLWVTLALGLYHLTSLHPAAPCGVIILLVLYAVSFTNKVKNLKNKLLDERDISREQSEELKDMTELLEKEHDVVESQKSAIDIMVREIDNEYVSRKAKAVTLAKMIYEMRELEGMRSALQDEKLTQREDSELKAAIQTVSKEKAAEKVKLYFEMSEKIPELEEEFSGKMDAVENLNETVMELATIAKARFPETNKTKPNTRKQLLTQTRSTGSTMKAVVVVALCTSAFAATLALKTCISAALIALQLGFYFLSRRQLKDDQQIPNVEALKTRLEQEIKRNKANRGQIGKLKRLLETEKSFKKSDECAKEIRQRVKERAAKRKLAGPAVP